MCGSDKRDSMIVPKPLPMQIADYLRERILHDTMKPGERIREQTVADSLAVSRTPIRDALRVLEAEGLVRIGLNHGATVISLDEETVRDALLVQATLEALAGHTVAGGRSSALNAVLLRHVERLNRAAEKSDGKSWFKSDVGFYKDIILHCRSNNISDIYYKISLITYRSRYLFRMNTLPSKTDCEAFYKIAAAIREGQPDTAKELIKTARYTG